MHDQNFKNVCLEVFYFCKILKMREKKYNEIRKLFLFLFYTVQREDPHRSSHGKS